MAKKVLKIDLWKSVLKVCKTLKYQLVQNIVHKVFHTMCGGGFLRKKSAAIG